jgi:alkylation response protein AidB-like acyl-CoA dehydrogenase
VTRDPIPHRRAVDEAIADLAAFAASGANETAVRGLQFDVGLAWPANPVGLGGLGLDGDAARRVARMLAERGLPVVPAGFVGPNLVAPVLVEHGTEAQRELLRPIFTLEHRWCQLFSEPSAGSDLANVSTLAVRDGERWHVRGQKVWNSFAAEATHGILLARSDPALPKHSGMTMFLLDDVVIADERRLGPVNDGWRLALAVLRHERSAIGGSSAGAERREQPTPLEQVVELGREVPGALRDRVVRAWVTKRVLDCTIARVMADARAGRPSVNETVIRVLATEHNFEALDLFLNVRGPDGMLHPEGYEDRGAHDGAGRDVVRDFLYARGLMIGGGTLEVCRNQIGERALGLPPEPRVDKEAPWRETSGTRARELGGGGEED